MIGLAVEGSALVMSVRFLDDVGGVVSSGTTTARLFHRQADGTLRTYDFNNDTFTTGAVTTATAAMTHRAGVNGTYLTGYWSVVDGVVSATTDGDDYLVIVENSGAYPTTQAGLFVRDTAAAAGFTPLALGVLLGVG